MSGLLTVTGQNIDNCKNRLNTRKTSWDQGKTCSSVGIRTSSL